MKMTEIMVAFALVELIDFKRFFSKNQFYNYLLVEH